MNVAAPERPHVVHCKTENPFRYLTGLRNREAVQGLKFRNRGCRKFDADLCRCPPFCPCLISDANAAMAEIQGKYIWKIRSFLQREFGAGLAEILHQAAQAISSTEPNGSSSEYRYASGLPTFLHATCHDRLASQFMSAAKFMSAACDRNWDVPRQLTRPSVECPC
jgi:hypothetical protein